MRGVFKVWGVDVLLLLLTTSSGGCCCCMRKPELENGSLEEGLMVSFILLQLTDGK
jgi:hypothetical protein